MLPDLLLFATKLSGELHRNLDAGAGYDRVLIELPEELLPFLFGFVMSRKESIRSSNVGFGSIVEVVSEKVVLYQVVESLEDTLSNVSSYLFSSVSADVGKDLRNLGLALPLYLLAVQRSRQLFHDGVTFRGELYEHEQVFDNGVSHGQVSLRIVESLQESGLQLRKHRLYEDAKLSHHYLQRFEDL